MEVTDKRCKGILEEMDMRSPFGREGFSIRKTDEPGEVELIMSKEFLNSRIEGAGYSFWEIVLALFMKEAWLRRNLIFIESLIRKQFGLADEDKLKGWDVEIIISTLKRVERVVVFLQSKKEVPA